MLKLRSIGQRCQVRQPDYCRNEQSGADRPAPRVYRAISSSLSSICRSGGSPLRSTSEASRHREEVDGSRYGRALARPPGPHGMNPDSCFRWRETVPRGVGLRKARPGALARPHRRGKNFREKHAYLNNYLPQFRQFPKTHSVIPIGAGQGAFASGELWLRSRACLKAVGSGAKHSFARPSRAVKFFRLRTSLPLFCSSR